MSTPPFPAWPKQTLKEYCYGLYLFYGLSKKQAAIEAIKLQRFF